MAKHKIYTSQKEAIKTAKARVSGNCQTHYIYRVQQDCAEVFSVSNRLNAANPPIIKVLYGGKVEHLEAGNVPEPGHRSSDRKGRPHMDEAFVEEITTLARQIAVYVGYSDLVDGLQPLSTLRDKFTHELEELYQAYSNTHTPEADVYAEAADCLYYAACAWAQGDEWPYEHLCAIVAYFDLEMAQVEAAALAKYRYRASGPNKKDFEIERKLIEAALERPA